MKIIQNILKRFGYEKKGIGTLPENSRFWRSLRSLANTDQNVSDPYEKSVWVFASINAIAQNISRVPFHIYTSSKKDIKTAVETGELYELFMNPNPFMISSTLFFATIIYLELYGEAFWVFDERSNITEIPKRIWVVDPTRMEPVIVKDNRGIDKFNGFWKYNVGSESLILQPHELLQFKYFNPYNPLRGLSGLEASRIGVEQDYFANKYNKQFFKDGVALSGIIKAPDFLTDEQFERLKSQFEDRHKGQSNAHKVGIIEGGADFVETKAMSQRDMEFTVLKRVIRGEILAAFKTNEVVLGNYENIQSYEGIRNAHEAFWKETLLPKIIYLEELLWSKFFSKIEGGRYWGGFDTSVIEALRDDFGKKVEQAKVLNEMGYPINVINKRLDLGFEDVPWGDTWFVKIGTVPVESLLSGGTTTPTEEPDEEKENDKEDNLDDEKNIDFTNRDDSAWARFISKQISIENLFKTKIKRYLFEQRKRVLVNIYKEEQPLDMVKEKELLYGLLQNLYLIAKNTGVDLLKDELTLEFDDCEDIQAFLLRRLEFSTTTILDSIKKAIDKILDVGDVEFRAKKAREFYNKIDNKVNVIARTESSAIINGVNYYLLKYNGIQYHKWLSKSEKGRHKHLHGKIVRIGESFSNKFTLRYPLDEKAPAGEVINCLCYCIPVITVKSC